MSFDEGLGRPSIGSDNGMEVGITGKSPIGAQLAVVIEIAKINRIRIRILFIK
jgi:hypothetical protein